MSEGRSRAAEASGDRPTAAESTGGASPTGPREAVLTEAGLERWGRRVGARAAGESVFVALRGPLGSGKTRLVQAACRGAGVEGPVQSPTYVLVRVYRTPDGAVHHADLYRIEDPRELADLAWDELTSGAGPVFVEWADRAERFLPADRWDIFLEMGATADHRRVRVVRRGMAPAPPPFPSEEATDGGR